MTKRKKPQVGTPYLGVATWLRGTPPGLGPVAQRPRTGHHYRELTAEGLLTIAAHLGQQVAKGKTPTKDALKKQICKIRSIPKSKPAKNPANAETTQKNENKPKRRTTRHPPRIHSKSKFCKIRSNPKKQKCKIRSSPKRRIQPEFGPNRSDVQQFRPPANAATAAYRKHQPPLCGDGDKTPRRR